MSLCKGCPQYAGNFLRSILFVPTIENGVAEKHNSFVRRLENAVRNRLAYFGKIGTPPHRILFDPGIGGLVKLWGFHADEFRAQLPDPVALAAWRKAQPGIADLRIDGRNVGSAKREVALDFGGYLKGVALDRAAELLRRQGMGNALVNIGGNVMALGTKNGEPWRIGIQHPRQPGPLATLTLADGEAVGTSGDYQRYFELDGRRYCHLIDPRSAEPVAHTQSLSVLVTPRAAAGTLSDAASKPLFIAGADWPRLAAAQGVTHVLRVAADGRVQVTAALHRRLQFPDGAPAGLEILP